MSLHLLRQLLLPLDPGREGKALVVLNAFLASQGISAEDAQGWLDSEIELWKSCGVASDELKALAEDMMHQATDQAEWTVSSNFFGIQEKLLEKGYELTWADARFLLSHVRLVADLARIHKMTAAKIARVLAEDEVQAPRYSRALSLILDALGIKRELGEAEVNALIAEDRVRALGMFADSSLGEAASVAQQASVRFGMSAPLGELLQSLADDHGEPFGPYLQMLHFILLVTEFYDHFGGEAYEFSPRGKVAQLIFSEHPDALRRGNPFLNNAKKVRVLNSAWAEGADDNLNAARSFAELLGHLDAAAYPVRREVARILRAWLMKVFDRFAGATVRLPESVNVEGFDRLLKAVATEQTRTGGVIEQRMVDLYCLDKYPVDEWMAVGIGDAANTTNVSKRKCGDVEMNHRTCTEIVAYEAHGGFLGGQYVREHIRTLGRVLSARETDLLTRAPVEDWEIAVVFVAHGFPEGLPDDITIDGGWKVSLRYKTFQDMRDHLTKNSKLEGLTEIFNTRVAPVLDSINTPNAVRGRVCELLGN